MVYGVDYDLPNVFYTVIFAFVIALGVYALIRPDFFRGKEQKGQPRTVRDIVLGTWLIVIGAFLTACTSWNVLLGIQYKARFSSADVAQFESLFCDNVKPTVSEDLPRVTTLPAAPYVLILCMDKNADATGVTCAVGCSVIYRPQTHPADSAERANAYIFIHTQGTETRRGGGLSARVIVYDKASNQVSVWFATRVGPGVNYRGFRQTPLQVLINRVAEKIAESQRRHRSG